MQGCCSGTGRAGRWSGWKTPGRRKNEAQGRTGKAAMDVFSSGKTLVSMVQRPVLSHTGWDRRLFARPQWWRRLRIAIPGCLDTQRRRRVPKPPR